MESGDKILLLTDTPRNTSRKRRQPDDKVSLPKLSTRSSPKALVDSIAKFNDEQKRAVEKMGFGYLLHLKIREIPSSLSFWLVDNFDPLSSVLRFSDGNIHIEAVDVEKVLGFPRGDKPIELKTRSETVDLLDKWRSQFLASSERITPEEVSKKMLDCKFEDGGEMFCCNFAALVDALIIGSINAGGYVNPLFLKSVSDITCVTNLNWAEYTLQSLIAKTLKWDHGKITSFNGPLLFLVVLYVDRLVFISRDVPRSLPSFIGWNCELLRKRSTAEVKKGGFGRGFVDDRMELLALQQQQQLLETLKLKQKKISDADVV